MERRTKKKLQYALAGLFLVGMLIIVGTSDEKWMDKTGGESAEKGQERAGKAKATDGRTDDVATPSTGERKGLSINSTMKELLADDGAKAILDKHMPGFTSSPELQQAMGMSFKQLAGFAQLPDAMLNTIDEELSKLGKGALADQEPKSSDKTALSINSTMKELMADERAKAIVEKHMPGVSSNPQLQQAMGMTLKQVAGFGPVPDATLKAMDEELGQLAEAALSEKGSTVVAVAVDLRKITAEEAKSTADSYIKAVGGSDAIAGIKTVKRTGTMNVNGSFGSLSGTVEEVSDLSNDRGYTTASVGGYLREAGWGGGSGWVRDAQAGVSDMAAEELFQSKSNSGPIPFGAIYARQVAEALKEAGEGEFNGKKCTVVRAEVGGSSIVLYINQKTNLLDGMSLPGNVEMIFENHQMVDGIQFPGKSTMKNAAQNITVMTEYNTTEVNGEIDTTKFGRP